LYEPFKIQLPWFLRRFFWWDKYPIKGIKMAP
jgi:hypothetical protein